MNDPYFRPSLQVPRAGWYALAAAMLASLPAAWLYAWATAPAPSPADPLCTLGMGLWLALAASCAAALGKVRHPGWMWRAGAALGICAWYLQWAAWLAQPAPSAPPPDLLQAAREAGAAGAWFLRPDLVLASASSRATGASSFLAGAATVVVWLVELCAFMLPPALAGARRAAAPFCEQAKAWAREVHVPVHFRFIDDPEEVRRRLERDPRQLAALLRPCGDEETRFAEITLHRCEGGTAFVTICNFAAMAPEQVPVPALGTLAEAAPERVECFAQLDEPVVELLRVPAGEVDALVRGWEAAAAS